MAETPEFYENWRKRFDEPMTFGETMELLRRFHIDSEMRHDREMDRIRASDVEARERMAKIEASHAKLEASQAKTEAALRRAIAFSVEDACRQRRRNAEYDKKHAEYDKKHAEHEKQDAEFRGWMRAFFERGGNGKP